MKQQLQYARSNNKRRLRSLSFMLAALTLTPVAVLGFQPVPRHRIWPATTSVSVVTDPVSLLLDEDTAIMTSAAERQATNDRLTSTFSLSGEQEGLAAMEAEAKRTISTTNSKVKFSGSTRKRRKTAKIITGSRSSTMPGYKEPTKNEEIFVQNIKYVESQTGKDLSRLYNEEAQARQKMAAGDAMYKASASVPDSLVQFARELHQEDRITPSEEVALGALTQEAIRIQLLYDNLEDSLQREPTDDEWCAAAGKINMEAIRLAMEDGLEAKNKLVVSNLRMVQRVVNIYIRNGLSGQYNASDMMQEGVMALIRAAEKFEPERGFRFSTYAMYWIRSAVKRNQTYQSRVITVPQRLHANHKKVLTTEKELRRELDRQPTQKELAHAVGMTEVQVDRCLKAMGQRCFSLDQKINYKKAGGDHSEDTFYSIISDKMDDGDYRKIQYSFLREDLVETLYSHLERSSADMILLRYGLTDSTRLPPGYEGPLTIAQVSQLVGKKPDKVRRTILKSLKDLRTRIGHDWEDFESLLV